jgi:hydrophobic/amphiphilic exporter-1 (mainly G- bacteria), HAE1 family
MGIAMLVAVFAVFLVMMIGLGGATASLAILFSLPLAAIGSFVALFVTGIVLDAPAMIGALMLIGIVVTNAIVLIDRVQHNRSAGFSIREALMEAVSRPGYQHDKFTAYFVGNPVCGLSFCDPFRLVSRKIPG